MKNQLLILLSPLLSSRQEELIEATEPQRWWWRRWRYWRCCGRWGAVVGASKLVLNGTWEGGVKGESFWF